MKSGARRRWIILTTLSGPREIEKCVLLYSDYYSIWLCISLTKTSDLGSNRCVIAANVIQCMFPWMYGDKIPGSAALCTYATCFSHGFSECGADMQFQSVQKGSVRSACGPSGRDHHRSGRWMTSTMMSAVGLPPQPVSPHPELKQMQLMHGCRCALGVGPRGSLTRDLSGKNELFLSSSLSILFLLFFFGKLHLKFSPEHLEWGYAILQNDLQTVFTHISSFISPENVWILTNGTAICSCSPFPSSPEVQTEISLFFLMSSRQNCDLVLVRRLLFDTTFAIRFSHESGDLVRGQGQQRSCVFTRTHWCKPGGDGR